MGASRLEYRFRHLLEGLILAVGLWPVLMATIGLGHYGDLLGLPGKSLWLIVSAAMARQGWLSFQAATSVLLVVAILFTALGALFRVWGAAYKGPGAVDSPATHGPTPSPDGPYRRTRNPLYLGMLLHTVGVALLMPPAGAIFAIAAVWLLQVRLALGEESQLAARFGETYLLYERQVPRFLPTPKAQVPAAGKRPHWLQALLAEIYFVGVVVTLAAFGWDFNATPLLKGILVSLGLALVTRALMPRPQPATPRVVA